jgi:hypothetical protein
MEQRHVDLDNKMEKMLMTWESKILRKMYGPTYEN